MSFRRLITQEYVTVSTRTILSSLLVIFFAQNSQAIQCYKCGTSGTHPKAYEHGEAVLEQNQLNPDYLESCNYFEKAGSARQHMASCASSQICVKMVTRGDDSDKETMIIQRGCAYKETAGGFQHSIGCGMLTPANFTLNFNLVDYEHACYCDTNYCNVSSSMHMFAFRVNVLLLLVKFFI